MAGRCSLTTPAPPPRCCSPLTRDDRACAARVVSNFVSGFSCLYARLRWVEKTGGCDNMMCGTTAHGDLRRAIANGGCGYTFNWKSQEAIRYRFINLEGAQVTGEPTEMYPTEIAALRAELGFQDAQHATNAASNRLRSIHGQGGSLW